MKRLMLMIWLFLACNSLIGQDECFMCGTWIGQWSGQQINPITDEFDDGIFKMYIRINQYGDEYKIRIKTTFPEHGWTTYESDALSIMDIGESFISFKLTSSLLPDIGANDVVVGYGNMERFYLLSYHNGYVHLTLEQQIQYDYDRNQRLIKKWDGLKFKKRMPEDDLDLFKDNDNW